jgi:integrase
MAAVIGHRRRGGLGAGIVQAWMGHASIATTNIYLHHLGMRGTREETHTVPEKHEARPDERLPGRSG